MLHKPNRLTTNFEFGVARKYGKTASGRFCHIYCVKPTNYTGSFKGGIVVSNKFHKNAVIRNRAKRIYRDIMRKKFDILGSKADNMWVVVYPKMSVLTAKHEEIIFDFDKTLQKVLVTN